MGERWEPEKYQIQEDDFKLKRHPPYTKRHGPDKLKYESRRFASLDSTAHHSRVGIRSNGSHYMGNMLDTGAHS